MLIGIFGWLFVGLLAGFIATKFVDLRGDEPGLGFTVGAASAIAGGWLFCAISGRPVSALNVWSLVVAAWTAIIAVVIWHAARRRCTAPVKARRVW